MPNGIFVQSLKDAFEENRKENLALSEKETNPFMKGYYRGKADAYEVASYDMTLAGGAK